MINDYQSKYKEITNKEAALAKADPHRLIMYACAVQIYQAMQFSISEPVASVVGIPAGTRATNGNNVSFATDEYVEIKAGEISVSVSATCTEEGSLGYNFAIGEF